MNEIVKLKSDRIEIEVWTLGARLNGVWFDGIGSLVDGSVTEDEARGAKKYNGAVVGPVANRIAGGRAVIDGTEHRFERNENGITTLHSGATGVHLQTWEVLRQQPDRLVMRLELPDGLGGFPGNRRLQVDYALGPDGMTVRFDASTDAPTWMNLALHPYWSLSKKGREDMRLSVRAETYTPVDDDKIPMGTLNPVTGTQFDLRELQVPDTGIDHNFCLSDLSDKTQHHVRMVGDLGVGLSVWTEAPGVQIYSGKVIGIAVEPQHFPDAMHHPAFPSIELWPGESYKQVSSYHFEKL